MYKHPRDASGFTLIELIIVLAIIGVVSVITLVSLSSARGTRDLDRSSREIVAALREAQNYALTGRSTSIGEDNCAFSVQVVGGSTGYSLSHLYRSGGSCSATGPLANYSLTTGVTFSASATVSFSLPRGEVTSGTTSIGLTKGGATYFVCVYPSGRILENGPSACP